MIPNWWYTIKSKGQTMKLKCWRAMRDEKDYIATPRLSIEWPLGNRSIDAFSGFSIVLMVFFTANLNWPTSCRMSFATISGPLFIINLGEDTPVLKQGRNRQYPISLHSTVPATVAKPPYMPPLFKRGCRHRLTSVCIDLAQPRLSIMISIRHHDLTMLSFPMK